MLEEEIGKEDENIENEEKLVSLIFFIFNFQSDKIMFENDDIDMFSKSAIVLRDSQLEII